MSPTAERSAPHAHLPESLPDPAALPHCGAAGLSGRLRAAGAAVCLSGLQRPHRHGTGQPGRGDAGSGGRARGSQARPACHRGFFRSLCAGTDAGRADGGPPCGADHAGGRPGPAAGAAAAAGSQNPPCPGPGRAFCRPGAGQADRRRKRLVRYELAGQRRQPDVPPPGDRPCHRQIHCAGGCQHRGHRHHWGGQCGHHHGRGRDHQGLDQRCADRGRGAL